MNKEQILLEIIELIEQQEIVQLICLINGISRDVYCKKPAEGVWFYPKTQKFYLNSYFDEAAIIISFCDITGYADPIKGQEKKFLETLENKKQKYLSIVKKYETFKNLATLYLLNQEEQLKLMYGLDDLTDLNACRAFMKCTIKKTIPTFNLETLADNFFSEAQNAKEILLCWPSEIIPNPFIEFVDYLSNYYNATASLSIT